MNWVQHTVVASAILVLLMVVPQLLSVGLRRMKKAPLSAADALHLDTSENDGLATKNSPRNLLDLHPGWGSLPGGRIEHLESGFYIEFHPGSRPDRTYLAFSPEGYPVAHGLHLEGLVQFLEILAADRSIFKP